MNAEMKYMNELEVLINLFTIEKGVLKVLLVRRDMEPYRGYWMLPTGLLLSNETIEECSREVLYEWLGLKDIHLENCGIYSELKRIPVERVIGSSLTGIIDIDSFNIKRKKNIESFAWFSVDEIPKVVYDHDQIIMDASKYIRKRLRQIDFLKHLFPSDFTLPELQMTYEQIIGKSLDRRNFRKKIIGLDILEDTKYKNEETNGRPAKLYRFKDEIEGEMMF